MKQFLTTIMFLCCLGASAASTVIPDMKFCAAWALVLPRQ